MPAKSAKQERFMQAVANNPKFAKKVGVPVTVGQEFTKKSGGGMAESKKMMAKEVAFMKKKGAPKSMLKHEMKEAGMKKMAIGGIALSAAKKAATQEEEKPWPKKGEMAPMKKMGPTMEKEESWPKRKEMQVPKETRSNQGMKKGGMAKYAKGGMVAPSKMGAVKTAAPSRDGVAVKGKTKGMMPKMAGAKGMKKGGYC
jgi:hypothetical protein